MDKTFSSGEVAKITGVAYRTLTRWEEEGRIKPPARDWRGRRRYTEEDIEKIKKIKQMRKKERYLIAVKNLEKGRQRRLLRIKREKKAGK